MEDTRRLGARLAASLRPGDVVALDGDLGAGKTALVKMVASAWGADESTVRSPTFALIHVHDLADITLVHADLYRLTAADELQSCGLLEYLADMSGVVAIEWPALAAPYLDDETVRITLRLRGDGTREVNVHWPDERESSA